MNDPLPAMISARPFEMRTMKNSIRSMKKLLTSLALGSAMTIVCFAGKAMKWEDVPEAVRQTILANGGKAGSVDREGERINGKAVYEAAVKNKKGEASDLVITEDGTLVTTKHDDAADQVQEQIAHAKKMLAGVKFSHPRDITNPYVPLASLKQDILEGTEGGKKIRMERTARPDKRRAFIIAGQEVEAFVVEDREFEDGVLAEVAVDYFVQDDNGTVYYLGEEVDEYENGKLKGHAGSWMLGRDTEIPGVFFPAHPKIGDRFRSEDVSDAIRENDEVVSITEKVITPAGTYENCVKVRENLADGTTEYKYYAPGVGVVREQPADGDVLLKTHTTNPAK